MVKEQAIREPYDNVQYKFFLFPDYESDRSAIVMKFHHNFGDGLAISSFMLTLAEEYNPKHMPSLKPISFGKKVLIKLLWPYLFMKANIDLLLMAGTHGTSSIMSTAPLSGVKKAAVLLDLPIVKMKILSKRMGVSLNDLTSGMLLTAVHEYMTINNVGADGKTYEVPKLINTVIPFSLREPF